MNKKILDINNYLVTNKLEKLSKKINAKDVFSNNKENNNSINELKIFLKKIGLNNIYINKIISYGYNKIDDLNNISIELLHSLGVNDNESLKIYLKVNKYFKDKQFESNNKEKLNTQILKNKKFIIKNSYQSNNKIMTKTFINKTKNSIKNNSLSILDYKKSTITQTDFKNYKIKTINCYNCLIKILENDYKCINFDNKIFCNNKCKSIYLSNNYIKCFKCKKEIKKITSIFKQRNRYCSYECTPTIEQLCSELNKELNTYITNKQNININSIRNNKSQNNNITIDNDSYLIKENYKNKYITNSNAVFHNLKSKESNNTKKDNIKSLLSNW